MPLSNGKSGRSAAWVAWVDFAIFAAVALGAMPVFASGGGGGKTPPYMEFAPILLLLGAIAILVWRLPKVKEEFPSQLAHLQDPALRFRRMLNWVTLGATYMFLYWGRYNLNPAIADIGGKEMVEEFYYLFATGTAVYAVSFLLNGPLTDRLGGRFSILMSAAGAAIANALIGVVCWLFVDGTIARGELFWYLLPLFALNMYFQSFGAVAIVKCNAAWFHVRERGVFGSVFGILIALGVYLAYDWSKYLITDLGWNLPVQWAFFAPAIALAVAFVCDILLARNRPSEAGQRDFDTGDATSGEKEQPDPPISVFKVMAKNRVIMTIACIECCTGFIRQAIMQGYPFFKKCVGGSDLFVYNHWGMLLCIGGILGGVFAGTISDRVFQSRRGPVVAVLYGGMLIGSMGMCFLLGSPYLGWAAVFISLCVIGVHGMLSGTASMDFGGVKNAGIAVGIIDGCVYFGTALQAVLYGLTLPKGKGAPGADDPSNWWFWPVALIPVAIIGLILAYRIRSEKPKAKFTTNAGDAIVIWVKDHTRRCIAEVVRPEGARTVNGMVQLVPLTVRAEEAGALATLEEGPKGARNFMVIGNETVNFQRDLRDGTRSYLATRKRWGQEVATGLKRFGVAEGTLRVLSLT